MGVLKAAPVSLTLTGRLHDCVFVLLLLHKVLELIGSYRCVKAWLNGHNHAGAYAEYQGIHFITFNGMVDTEEISYG